MGILNKLFGTKSKTDNPDNKKLLNLIEEYWKSDGKGDTYKNVVLELLNGNSFLMFPTKDNENTFQDKWETIEKDTTLSIASVVNLDGLKVLGAFTDETALLNWTKKASQYTAMRSQDVLKFVENNGMDRIVINSDQPNMFVLERNRGNVTSNIIKENTTVQYGTPNNPLNPNIIRQLLESFEKNNTIVEVYQYGLTKNDEYSIVLGFKLSIYNENSKKAAISSVQNVLENEKLNVLLDLFFLESEEWYENIKKVEDSLIYMKNGL